MSRDAEKIVQNIARLDDQACLIASQCGFNLCGHVVLHHSIRLYGLEQFGILGESPPLIVPRRQYATPTHNVSPLATFALYVLYAMYRATVRSADDGSSGGDFSSHSRRSEYEVMQSRRDIAAALGISDKRLCLILYRRRQRQRYRTFEIPKRAGGSRVISAPPRELLWLQRQACRFLSQFYTPKACVHGFVHDKTIVSNARFHSRREYIVNLDLEEFFPSIHFGRTRGIFLSSPFNFGEEAATVIAQICCRDDGTLPQGGATSPIVSNLVCRGLDSELLAFAMEHRLRYSRYADDLTFSSSRHSLPLQLIDPSTSPPKPGPQVEDIIHRNGFQLNKSKVRLRSRRRRQEVTGLTANRFPNVRRTFVREVEGALHAWEKHGYEAAQREYESRIRVEGGFQLENVVRGKIAFLKMVRGESDHAYRRLARRFNRIASTQVSLDPLKTARSSKLCNVPRDWDVWIAKVKSSVFFLRFYNADGDECCGSAFHVGGSILATARHNVVTEAGNRHNGHQVKVNGEWKDVEILSSEKVRPDGADICALRLQDLSADRGIPTQLRIPELGEEVMAIGFPKIPLRDPTVVTHVGWVEALPIGIRNGQLYLQVSFQSGGGLSGGCLIDKSGHVLGVMVENVFMGADPTAPQRPYGQAVPMEYFDEYLALPLSPITNAMSTITDAAETPAGDVVAPPDS